MIDKGKQEWDGFNDFLNGSRQGQGGAKDLIDKGRDSRVLPLYPDSTLATDSNTFAFFPMLLEIF